MRSAGPLHAAYLCGMFGRACRIDGFLPGTSCKPLRQRRYRKNLQGQMGQEGTV